MIKYKINVGYDCRKESMNYVHELNKLKIYDNLHILNFLLVAYKQACKCLFIGGVNYVSDKFKERINKTHEAVVVPIQRDGLWIGLHKQGEWRKLSALFV